MNILKINFLRSLLVALVGSLTFMVACDNEEQVAPDMSAYFKVRNVIDEENPLEAPADMIFVNGSKNGLAYEWNFGDGYLKNDPDKSNTYVGVSPDTVLFPLPGTYEVQVTVIGSDGQKNETYSQTYVVNKETPKISYEPEDILVDTTVYFNVSYFLREDATATFNWSFEDGEPATSTIENPEVKFTSAGLKTVTLELNDGDEILTVSTQVEIKEELAPTLYFTDMSNQQIYKKRIFKTLASDLAEPVVSTGIVLPDNSKPMTMVVDNRRVFVTNTDSNTGTATFGEIISFNLDGSEKSTVATGGSGHYVPFSMMIVGNDMYFTDRFNGVHKMNKSSVEMPIGAGSLWLHHKDTEFYGNGIGWGHQNGTIYYYQNKMWWSKNSNGSGIFKFDLSLPKNDAGQVTGEKMMESYPMRSFFIDEANDKIYFYINKPVGENPIGIYVANIDGTNITLIEEYEHGVNFDATGGAFQYLGVTGITVLGDNVYWGYRDALNSPATSGVKRANLDGTGVEMYLRGYVPYGIAADNVPR